MPDALTVRVVTSREDWTKLQSDWNRLLLQSAAPTIYLSYEWLTTWWDCIAGPNTSLYVLVVERGGKIVAIAPLMRVVKRILGIPLRKIQFVSTMKKPAHLSTLSAHLDIIGADQDGLATQAVFEHLTREAPRWDYIQLHPVPEDSLTLRCDGTPLLNLSKRCLVQPALQSSMLRIEGSWDDYTKKLRHDIKKVMKSAEGSAAGMKEVRVAEYDSLEDVPGGFATLLDIERRSWKWNKGVSLNSALFRGFYRQLALNLRGTGMLRIHILELEDRPVAYNYSVKFGGVIYGLRMSFDLSYRNRSPGKFLVYYLLRIAFENHLAAVDFGWGDAHGQYKSTMTNSLLVCNELMVFSDSVLGRLSKAYFQSPRLRLTVDQGVDFFHRVARYVGLHLRSSELTREDQLRGHSGKA